MWRDPTRRVARGRACGAFGRACGAFGRACGAFRTGVWRVSDGWRCGIALSALVFLESSGASSATAASITWSTLGRSPRSRRVVPPARVLSHNLQRSPRLRQLSCQPFVLLRQPYASAFRLARTRRLVRQHLRRFSGAVVEAVRSNTAPVPNAPHTRPNAPHARPNTPHTRPNTPHAGANAPHGWVGCAQGRLGVLRLGHWWSWTEVVSLQGFLRFALRELLRSLVICPVGTGLPRWVP